MRVAFVHSEEKLFHVRCRSFATISVSSGMLQSDLMDPMLPDPLLDGVICACLLKYLQSRLENYRSMVHASSNSCGIHHVHRSPIEVDLQTLKDPNASAREKVAATLLRIEKEILHRTVDDLLKRAGVQGTLPDSSSSASILFPDASDLPALPPSVPVKLS